MTFNIKSNFAIAVAQNVLRKPAGMRHGVSGFWLASLKRVQDERLIRIAYMPDRRFVLEAEIDGEATHVMVAERLDEYLEHECLKRSQSNETQSLDTMRAAMKRCIEQGRLVVAFRNARAIDGHCDHTGQNPVWYSEEE